jgi:dTDP-L-rhamnose 4-epimerase
LPELQGERSGTCLVTGGAGFIGCALSPLLVRRFGRVVAIDNLHPQVHKQARRPAALADGVELIVGDVADAAMWDAALVDLEPDVVIHLAAETGTGQSLTEASRHAATNVLGTAAMLDAMARNEAVPRLIVLSATRAVYGEGAWRAADGTVSYPGQRTREQLEADTWDFPGLVPLPSEGSATRPAPVSIYGSTKLAQEHMISNWAAAFGALPVMLRLQNVYGPGQSLSNPYTGIVSLFCRLAAAGQSIPVYEDGAMLRDFVFIDDVAAAFLCALDRVEVSVPPLDIGTGRSVTVLQLAQAVAELYGAPAPHICGKYRLGDVRHAQCSTERSASTLGWRAEVGLKDGLAQLASWIAAQ